MPVLVTVDDPRVLDSAVVEGDEVRVVSEEDSAFSVRMGKLYRVDGPEQADVTLENFGRPIPEA